MQEIATRYGVLEAYEAADDLICRCLSKYGEWAQYELQFVADNVAPGSRVADIGAFIGTFGLGLSQLRKLDRLCFVEANAATAELLRKNVARNVSVVSEVVEAIVGPFDDQSSGTFAPGNKGSFSVTTREDGTIEAPAATSTISLRALSERHGRFDFYKVDVEGAEKAIFSSELDFVQNSNATFWIECNETIESLDLGELFLNLGFSVFYFAFPAISSQPFREGAPNEFPFAYEAGLWVTRNHAPHLNAELRGAGCMLERVTSRESLRWQLWRTPRWAPADWLNSERSELAALAVHRLFGEAYETFLTHSSPHSSANAARKWAEPVPVQMQRLIADMREQMEQTQSELTEARNHARAADIVLFAERARSETAIARLEDELRGLYARIDSSEKRNAELLSSSSWRLTMPLRMMSRLLHGDWREVKRIIGVKVGGG
ncbi:FkbM family methyltransferase [Paraburkholderia phenoliruptrix]|uniref:FkbM family methyltransferase n=2 Tax=Paraburkholderia phenoliruptrix TaxID=252970 RepID=K0DJA0_9BURK|nr:FkbM family methyltransferase [Paraburkholderia phenoliruptrix]AFT84807.1 FkbM family methyltransferase [Paraburkholderia phenoliruptrix BR3459a]CAB4050500.1 hypothetical protein LMG9964_04166 [Paraburkholderia phenoliruptrix]